MRGAGQKTRRGGHIGHIYISVVGCDAPVRLIIDGAPTGEGDVAPGPIHRIVRTEIGIKGAVVDMNVTASIGDEVAGGLRRGGACIGDWDGAKQRAVGVVFRLPNRSFTSSARQSSQDSPDLLYVP